MKALLGERRDTVRSSTILGAASSAKYRPDIKGFAVRLKRNTTNILALAQEALSVRSIDRQRAGGSITMQTAIGLPLGTFRQDSVWGIGGFPQLL
jgi:hypothetical protein